MIATTIPFSRFHWLPSGVPRFVYRYHDVQLTSGRIPAGVGQWYVGSLVSFLLRGAGHVLAFHEH